MNQVIENEPRLSMLEAAAAVSGGKNGQGIGQFVDRKTLQAWIEDFRASGKETRGLEPAFQYGVEAEARFAGISFVEAEPELRSEWSSDAAIRRGKRSATRSGRDLTGPANGASDDYRYRASTLATSASFFWARSEVSKSPFASSFITSTKSASRAQYAACSGRPPARECNFARRSRAAILSGCAHGDLGKDFRE